MPLQETDKFIVQRGSVQYEMTADQLADFVGAVRDFTVADNTARDALTDLNIGDRVFSTSAVDDSTVDDGWAIYRVQSLSPTVFFKVQEQESMDIVVVGVTDLSYTPSANQGQVSSSTGTDAIIPIVNTTHAGLATPQMLTDSHVKAVTSGTTDSNPINIDPTTQSVSFNIGQLLPLP